MVTQRGDFVTTLGRGMSVGTLAIVPRSVWEAARRNQARLNEAFAQANEMSQKKLSSLHKELSGRGPWVSRETMSVMITLSKLFPDRILHRWSEVMRELSDALRMIRTRDRWHRLGDDFFDAAGRVLWKVAHMNASPVPDDA